MTWNSVQKVGFDFIAASFVSTSADIDYLRKYTHSLGWFNVRIIAKIENLEGVKILMKFWNLLMVSWLLVVTLV